MTTNTPTQRPDERPGAAGPMSGQGLPAGWGPVDELPAECDDVDHYEATVPTVGPERSTRPPVRYCADCEPIWHDRRIHGPTGQMMARIAAG